MFPTQPSPSTALRMSQNAICFQDFHFAVASTNLKVVQKLEVFWHSVARPHYNDPRFFEKPTSSLSFHDDRHPPSPPQVAEGCVFSGMSTLRSCMHARQLHRKTFELQGSTVDTAVQRSSMLAESRTFPKFPPSPSHRPVLICSESKNSESYLCDRRQQCTRVRRSPQFTAQIHKDAGSPQRSSDRSQLAFRYSAQVLVDKIHGHGRRPQRVSAWMALEARFPAPANLNLNWKQTGQFVSSSTFECVGAFFADGA